MKNTLVIDNSEILETRFVLERLPVIIGRDSAADIRIEDRWMSRRNCEIFEEDGGLFVRDLNSSNGTLVNGRHVTQSAITPGDTLTVGMSTFVLSDEGCEAEAAMGRSTLVLRCDAAVAWNSAGDVRREKPR